MVKLVFDETNNPTFIHHERDNRPPVMFVMAAFKELRKKYTPRIAATTLAIATGDNYLSYKDSRDTQNKQQRLVVNSDGLKLITSPTYFLNELAGVVGKVAPIIISIVALIASVYAIYYK